MYIPASLFSFTDCDSVSRGGVWNMFCVKLFYLGRALLWSGECLCSLTLLSITRHLHLIYALNKSIRFTDLQIIHQSCCYESDMSVFSPTVLRSPSLPCWLCCACGLGSPCLLCIWGTTSASGSSHMTIRCAQTRSRGRCLSSAGT